MKDKQQYLQDTIDVLNNLKYSDICEIVKEEHLVLILDEILTELGGENVSVKNSFNGFSIFRKTIIREEGLDPTTKINLLKAIV